MSDPKQHRDDFFRNLNVESKDQFENDAKKGWQQIDSDKQEILSRLDSKIDDRTKKSVNWKIWAVSAAAILILGFLVYSEFLSNPKTDTTLADENLFETHYEKFPSVIPISRSGSAHPLGKVMQLYESDAYEDFLSKTPSELGLTSANLTLFQFYSALSHMELGNFSQAIELFQSCLKNHDFAYKNEGYWYLGLAHLGNENKKQAVSEFAKIQAEHYLYADAQGLIKKLQ